MQASGKRPNTIGLVRIILETFTAIVQPTWVHLIDAQTLDRYRRARLKAPGKNGKLSPETVKKELRHLRAALNVAKRWKYLREVPPLPKVISDEKEKPHVSEPHFLAMLKATDVATQPNMRLHQKLPEGVTAGDWWRALLVTAWVTGARIDSILRLRWQDMDWEAGRILSRAADLKQRKDTRPEIAGALPYLARIRGEDPRLLPWNHNRRSLYAQFQKIQKAAGIDLVCPREGERGHVCRQSCHHYGFHAFRYAHARFNYANPELQNQMGHACAATTEHYRQWAERQMATYGAYVPAPLQDPRKLAANQRKDAVPPDQQRKNGGTESGSGRLRVVSA